MHAIITKADTIKIQTLTEVAEMLKDDFSDEAAIVTEAILASLEKRMPEDKFVAFCESIEG